MIAIASIPVPFCVASSWGALDRMRTIASICSRLGNWLLDLSFRIEMHRARRIIKRERDDALEYEYAAHDWTDRPDVSRPPFLPDVETVERSR